MNMYLTLMDDTDETAEENFASNILPSKYEKVEIDQVIKEQTHLDTDQKKDLKHHTLGQCPILFNGQLGQIYHCGTHSNVLHRQRIHNCPLLLMPMSYVDGKYTIAHPAVGNWTRPNNHNTGTPACAQSTCMGMTPFLLAPVICEDTDALTLYHVRKLMAWVFHPSTMV